MEEEILRMIPFSWLLQDIYVGTVFNYLFIFQAFFAIRILNHRLNFMKKMETMR